MAFSFSANSGPSISDVAAGEPKGLMVLGHVVSGENGMNECAWSEAHPLVAAYRAYRPMPYDAPAVAMVAAVYAVRPQENYFRISDPGTVTVAGDGRFRLAPAPGGKHRTLIADPAQKDRIRQIYAETASTKPVGRVQRFRPPQKKQ